MSNLNITERRVGDITIVDLDGKVTIGDTNRRLHEKLRSIVTDGRNKIILNLKKVKVIDSSGLGEIVAGYSTLKAHGGSLVLINMPDRVTDLMTITKLYTVFDVFQSESEALSALENELPATEPLDNNFPAKVARVSSIH